MFQDDIQINNELATHAVLAIHDRLQEHIKVRGQPQRNDKKLWNILDEFKGYIGAEAFRILVSLAEKHRDYDFEMELWAKEMLMQPEFEIRSTKDAKLKTCDQNRMIWKLIMRADEVMKEQGKYDPKRDLFN
tara:strand:+ start:2488 stop:2883 length:396 start_codon:yes stop_codon:yes gene_type:complete